MMKKDYSYGVVPVYHDGQDDCFLLVQLHSGNHWGFPKGHKEGNESDLVAAQRELAEEVGIVDVKIDDTRSYVESYIFDYKDLPLEKEVSYFVGRVAEKFVPQIQEEEVMEARRCRRDEVMDLLTYESTKSMFAEVLRHLD